jgi:outer membrane immunogenic protein
MRAGWVPGIAAALLLAAAGWPASAAEPQTAPQPYNWTGLYVGLQAGGGWSDDDTAVNFLPTPALFFASPFTFSPDGDGWLGGAQIGFNLQTGVWVLGIEGDLAYTSIDSQGTVAPILSPGGVPLAGTFHTSSTEMNWFGTLRLRSGVAFDRFVLYVTGGLAAAGLDFATTVAGPGIAYTATASDTATGWTMGTVLELALAPNWSVKAEYLFYDLGNTTLIASPVPANPPFQTATTFDTSGHIVRFGLNYRFGPMPVTAR